MVNYQIFFNDWSSDVELIYTIQMLHLIDEKKVKDF